MSETTIATGTYTIENVDRRNDIFLAGDGRGSLVAGSSDSDADPPMKARWVLRLQRNGRYTISPAMQRNMYASCPTSCGLRSEIVLSSIDHHWVVKETRVKGTFVISHVLHQLYWGIEDDEAGTPVRLRQPPTGSGNQWRFHPCLGSTPNAPQNVFDSRNIDRNVDSQTATVQTRSRTREVVDSRPSTSTPVVLHSVVGSLAIDGGNIDSQANTATQISEVVDGRAANPTPVVPQSVIDSRNDDETLDTESLDTQTAAILTPSQTTKAVGSQSSTPIPVVPQGVVESRNIAAIQTASSPSQTKNANDVRPAIRHKLKGHFNGVYSAAYSPDGETIVSGGHDSTIRVWDVRTGRLALKLDNGYSGTVHSVTISPDGKQIVSGSGDGTVRFWDAQSGTLGATLTGHTEWVSSLAWSPGGKRVVSGSGDKTIRVWDAEIRRLKLGPLLEHTGYVMTVNFSMDGKQLLSGSADGTVRVWDAATWHVMRTFTEQCVVWSAIFSPDRKQIVSGDDRGNVRVWDMQTSDSIVLSGHKGTVYSVRFSPDGERFVSAGYQGQIIVWDANSLHALGTLRCNGYQIHSVGFSPDGRWIVSGAGDGMIRIWEADRLDDTPELRRGWDSDKDSICTMPELGESSRCRIC
ncbi:WD40 repeat-like protein [Rickenella mellea]|uniref:WD40 repeat-like protein n=1 Tax=Rickenella mellea TaxID=50990 RepID=A0A4Y7PJ03_9AGAM|nr:WD40 repeat-like protein [Rickenella mellea]